MSRAVTERDFRIPEFRDANVEDYEFRSDGKLVRKDRFQTGMRDIAWLFFSSDYEIPDVVDRVEFVKGLADGVLQLAGDSIWAELRGVAE